MSRVEALLQSLLKTLLAYLTTDQRLKFNKIHKPLADMNTSEILDAIVLVEKTLDNNDVRPIRVLENALARISSNDEAGYDVKYEVN